MNWNDPAIKFASIANVGLDAAQDKNKVLTEMRENVTKKITELESQGKEREAYIWKRALNIIEKHAEKQAK